MYLRFLLPVNTKGAGSKNPSVDFDGDKVKYSSLSAEKDEKIAAVKGKGIRTWIDESC